MKTNLECIPCFVKQSLEAAKMATDDEEIQLKVMKAVMDHLQNISFTNSPPELSREVHEIIRNITKSKDPYRDVKNKSNEMAKKYYTKLKKILEESEDPLLTSIKIAIIGNVIDFGTINRFNVDDMLKDLIKKKIDEKSYNDFKSTLKKSKTILYLADNNGEIFFDKLLIEEIAKLDKKIYFVVRKNPIINDITIEDAKQVGIDKYADIIAADKGQKISAPGIVLDFSSEEFIDLFKRSDMIISKGQGNYEGLSDVDRKVFFMLVVKCPLVAYDIDDEVGRLILKVKE